MVQRMPWPQFSPMVLGVLWGLWGAAPAQASPEYRAAHLHDGRTLVGQIQGTSDRGVVLTVPQGTVFFGFDELLQLSPVDRLEYEGQPPWTVWVTAETPGLAKATAQLFAHLPHVEALPVDEVPEGNLCEGEVECLVRLSRGFGWRWLLTVELSSSGRVRLTMQTNAPESAPTVRRAAREDVLAALHSLLSLQVPAHLPTEATLALSTPAPAPPETTKVEPPSPPPLPPTKDMGRRSVQASSPASNRSPLALWVPVPGHPGLRRRPRTMGRALAWAVPFSAGFIGIVGQQSPTRFGFALRSLAGMYVTTVAVNGAVAAGMPASRPVLHFGGSVSTSPQLGQGVGGGVASFLRLGPWASLRIAPRLDRVWGGEACKRTVSWRVTPASTPPPIRAAEPECSTLWQGSLTVGPEAHVGLTRALEMYGHAAVGGLIQHHTHELPEALSPGPAARVSTSVAALTELSVGFRLRGLFVEASHVLAWVPEAVIASTPQPGVVRRDSFLNPSFRLSVGAVLRRKAPSE